MVVGVRVGVRVQHAPAGQLVGGSDVGLRRELRGRVDGADRVREHFVCRMAGGERTGRERRRSKRQGGGKDAREEGLRH